MALYSYRAMNPHGKIVHGRLDAINPVDLEMRLRRLGLDLITNSRAARRAFIRSHRVARGELITFCFHMDQLMRAGVPIIEALIDLRDSIQHAAFRETIANLVESIEGGMRFSEAMAAHPDVFDTVFVSLIKAGEQSGQLPSVLAKLTENLKWQDELAAQTRKILIYPAFIAAIVVAVVFFLMLYMVPQLVQFIKLMQRDVPLQTRALIAISEFFVRYWYLIIAAPVLLLFVARILLRRSPALHYRLDAAKLALPVLGPILNKIILARFSTYFAMMYASGISILECLATSEKIAGNRVIEQGLQRVGRNIAEGQGISQSFKSVDLFPPLVLRMLRVGESTGGIDVALLNVSYFYNRDVKESIERVQSMIEPTLTLVLGGLLGWVILAVLGPIYDIITTIKL